MVGRFKHRDAPVCPSPGPVVSYLGIRRGKQVVHHVRRGSRFFSLYRTNIDAALRYLVTMSRYGSSAERGSPGEKGLLIYMGLFETIPLMYIANLFPMAFVGQVIVDESSLFFPVHEERYHEDGHLLLNHI